MPETVRQRVFTFSETSTCKIRWIFQLVDGPAGPVIRDLEIRAFVKENGKELGCRGHPKTIIALVRGRPLRDLDSEALALAACIKELSCGQALARCLRELAAESPPVGP